MSLFQEWLAQLRSWSADAAEWSEVEEFVAAVREVADAKREVREASRDRLRAALATLREQTDEELTYLEIADLDKLDPAVLTATQASRLLPQIEQLQADLVAHQAARQRPTPTRSSDWLRRQELDRLAESIIEGVRGIHAVWTEGQVSGPDARLAEQPPARPAAESPPPEPSAGLASHGAPAPDDPAGGAPEEPATDAPPVPAMMGADAADEAVELVAEPTPTGRASEPADEGQPALDVAPSTPLAVSPADPAPAPALLPSPEALLEPPRPPPPSDSLPPAAPLPANGPTLPGRSLPTDAISRPPDTPPRSPRRDEGRPRPVDAPAASPRAIPLPSLNLSVPPPEPQFPLTSPLAEDQQAPAVAERLSKTEDEALWEEFFWTLVAEDDLAAAYWLARSQEAGGRPAPVSSYLLQALLGSHWLAAERDHLAPNLEDIALEYEPTADDLSCLLASGAALCPSLLVPGSGLTTWLRRCSLAPTLNPLLEAVRQFAEQGLVLRRDDIRQIVAHEARQEALAALADETKQWLAKEQTHTITYADATFVWQYLVTKTVDEEGDLYTMLAPVAEQRYQDAEVVRGLLRDWERPRHITGRVADINRAQLRGMRPRPIQGTALQELRRGIDEACDLAQRWLKLVEEEAETPIEDSWSVGQIKMLRNTVSTYVPDIEATLAELDEAPSTPPRAVAACLRRVMADLRLVLGLADDDDSPLPQRWNWLAEGNPTLEGALRRFLLWLPDIPLDAQGQPQPDSLPQVAPAVRDAYAQQRSFHDAFEGWLARKDFRFVEGFLDAIQAEPPDNAWYARYRTALEDARSELRRRMNDARTAIEKAVLNGIILEERAQYAAQVEAITPGQELNSPSRLKELASIETALSQARQKRLSELRGLWEKLAPDLDTFKAMEGQDKDLIRDFITKQLDKEDPRVVDEAMARLRAVLYGETDNWLTPSAPDAQWGLDDFLKTLQQPVEERFQGRTLSQLMEQVQQTRGLGTIDLGDLPESRIQELADALKAWLDLRQGTGPRYAYLRVPKVLRYLGFTPTLDHDMRGEQLQAGDDWVYLRVPMSAGDVARPIPQFGSQAHGRYDVVCVWERANPDTLGAWLQDLRLERQTVLMLYLGRLSKAQRQRLMQICRRRELALAVLDETLLLYLASVTGSRLPVFLRCALPYATVNPYTPSAAGNVPPEMFFGREALAFELQRLDGPCLIYGGRQLGKSALLRRVERDFHHPEQQRYARVLDIKKVGDPTTDLPTAAALWKLRDALCEMGLLPEGVSDRPDDIIGHVRRAMQQDPTRRMIIMYDEADEFLRADTGDSFRLVEMFRDLMAETGRRFRVVFAGLQFVQRFQGLPNHPLVHFGHPRSVGPLESSAALDLVRKPLETLGYRFEDDATPLLILSYTNYHAALIQLFCYELLKRLYNRNLTMPYTIQRRDVEEIYLLNEVRDRIRAAFHWTLELDTRYRAIAWSMVVDQMAQRDSYDGYAHFYSPSDVLKLAASQWPQGFKKLDDQEERDLDDEEIRRLLEEMRGLGVLMRRQDEKQYQLSSPNLVRLMGTADEILDRLASLSGRRPERPFDPDNHHLLLATDPPRYSPLTFAQDRSLAPHTSGVDLVFASEALGLADLPDAFSHYVGSAQDTAQSQWAEIAGSVTTPDWLRTWLDAHLAALPAAAGLVAYQRLRGLAAADQAALVETALEFCASLPTHQQWLRILFVFDPSATQEWLRLPTDRRSELENRVDVTLSPQRWNSIGLRKSLDQLEKYNTNEVCEEVMRVTGGWHLLLQTVFDAPGSELTLDPLTHGLSTPEAELAGSVWRQMGMQTGSVAHRVFVAIRELSAMDDNKPVPLDVITPDMLQGEPVLSAAECEQAVEYLRRLRMIDFRDGGVVLDPIADQIAPPL